jgi:hypothetical protein
MRRAASALKPANIINTANTKDHNFMTSPNYF